MEAIAGPQQEEAVRQPCTLNGMVIHMRQRKADKEGLVTATTLERGTKRSGHMPQVHFQDSDMRLTFKQRDRAVHN